MHKSLHSRQYRDVLVQLRLLRQRLGLRQLDLARRLGRAQSLVSRVESGERRLDIVELWVWLCALQTDLVSFAADLERRLAKDGLSLHHMPPEEPTESPSKPARTQRRSRIS